VFTVAFGALKSSTWGCKSTAHVVIRVKTEVRAADTKMGIWRLDYAFFLDHGPVGRTEVL